MPGDRMSFSIVTPVCNGMKYLPRCVGSIHGQSLGDVEHIIVDGVSRDGTQEWLRAIAERKEYSGRLTWLSEPDDGMYDAINKGWALSHGDILGWLNCDEQYLPGVLESVAGWFERWPEVDLIYGDAIIVDQNGDALAARREVPLRHLYIRNTFLNAYTCTMFFRRRLWEAGWLRLDTRYRYAGDMDLILRLLEAGVRHLSTHRYHALFGAVGDNLSTHGGMKDEIRAIQKIHGGANSVIWRRSVQCLRQFERLARGQYTRRNVEYGICSDETGLFRKRQAFRLSGRFNIDSLGGL